MPTLLIAGPLALDDFPGAPGLLGGVGGYAAMAAAPLATTQLWTRGGSDITPQLRGILERRHIDLAGVGWEGRTPRGSAMGFEPHGDVLPGIEPTSADDLGGVLLIGLPPAEMRRAFAVVGALPGAPSRTLVISPRPADLAADRAYLAEVCAQSDVLVLSVAKAQELTGTANALDAARALQKKGAKAVVLTAGLLGGLIAYSQKVTTYQTLPIETSDKSGVSAVFPGVLAAWCAGAGKADFRALKRACAMASAVGGICAQGQGPLKLLAADRKEYLERFNRLRRAGKY